MNPNKRNKLLIDKSIRRAGMRRRRRAKVVGLILARGGSKGIPRKNLAHLAGYPLVAHSILALHSAGIEPYVSTEDQEIKDVSELYGATVIDRPIELATAISSTESVIANFLKQVEADIVVLVQCTSPMLNPNDIAKGLHKFFACGLDSLFSAVLTNDTLIWDKHLKPMNYNPRHRKTRQKRKKFVCIETGAFYIFTRKIFEQKKCRLGGMIGVQPVPFWESFQIDSKKDLLMIRKLMSKNEWS